MWKLIHLGLYVYLMLCLHNWLILSQTTGLPSPVVPPRKGSNLPRSTTEFLLFFKSHRVSYLRTNLVSLQKWTRSGWYYSYWTPLVISEATRGWHEVLRCALCWISCAALQVPRLNAPSLLVWEAHSPSSVCCWGPPSPPARKSGKVLGLPFPASSGSQPVVGCAKSLSLPPPHRIGQLLEEAGKGNLSTFPPWLAAGEGGIQQCTDESEWISRVRGTLSAAPGDSACLETTNIAEANSATITLSSKDKPGNRLHHNILAGSQILVSLMAGAYASTVHF